MKHKWGSLSSVKNLKGDKQNKRQIQNLIDMKKNKIITSLVLVFGVLLMTQAQEYKFNASGKVLFNGINKIAFEGHDGSDVIISTMGKSSSTPERAEGLKLINGLGLDDNTGIGLSVQKSDGMTIVDEISKRSNNRYLVKVPKGVIVAYQHSTPHGSKVVFTDISSEIEVKTNHSGVRLENVTGPMTISTVHGKIEAIFSSLKQDDPISIISSHGLVDVSLPSASKANVRLGSGWGEIYSDFEIDMGKSENLRSYSSNEVRGKINGGGVDVNLSSSHGNVYLRKGK